MNPRHERPAAGSRRDLDRVERIHRARAAGLVAVLLAAVLVAGSTLHAAPERTAAVLPSGLLPSVNLTSDASVAWDCPGPLPAGATTERSVVIVVNAGTHSADVVVEVVGTSAPAKGTGTSLVPWSTQLALAPHTEHAVPLRTTGPAQNDAVRVLSTTGAVAVFESVTPFSGTPAASHAGGGAGKRASSPEPTITAAPEESPCAVGTSPTSYIATGSTLGKSSVLVSLFNPTATQAVVGLTVSTGSASVAPPALQGLIIKPDSVQLFDLGRWVVQQGTVAVAVTATIGRIAVGAAETQSAISSATGQALVLGVQRSQLAWTFTPGPLASGRVTVVRAYDPESKPATVTISSPIAGHAAIEITDVIPAGGVRAIALPLPGAAKRATGQGGSATPAPLEGPIVVRSAQGVGIVVARITSLLADGHQTITNIAVTSGPANGWVLPAATALVPLTGSVEVSNPGSTSVEVEVTELTSASGRPELAPVGTLTVGPGSTVTAPVSVPVSLSLFEGLFVRASSAVVVEQDLSAATTTRGAPAAAPNPVEGVPVLS